MKPICDLTWGDVRKRSESTVGLKTYCGDCYVQFHSGGTPCLRHTLPSEIPARDARITELFKAIASRPMELKP